MSKKQLEDLFTKPKRFKIPRPKKSIYLPRIENNEIEDNIIKKVGNLFRL